MAEKKENKAKGKAGNPGAARLAKTGAGTHNPKELRIEQRKAKKQEAQKTRNARVKEKYSKKKPVTGEKASALAENILYPLISEKSVGAIETENKIVFVVREGATKQDVRNAVEGLYAVKVDKVNVMRSMNGKKKAIVKINRAFRAQELATKLGVI